MKFFNTVGRMQHQNSNQRIQKEKENPYVLFQVAVQESISNALVAIQDQGSEQPKFPLVLVPFFTLALSTNIKCLSSKIQCFIVFSVFPPFSRKMIIFGNAKPLVQGVIHQTVSFGHQWAQIRVQHLVLGSTTLECEIWSRIEPHQSVTLHILNHIKVLQSNYQTLIWVNPGPNIAL